MLRCLLGIFTLCFCQFSYSQSTEQQTNQLVTEPQIYDDHKNVHTDKIWAELSVGEIADEIGIGLKAKFKFKPDYTYGFEIAVSDGNELFSGKSSNTGEDIDDLIQVNFTLGREWSYSIFQVSTDIGVGVAKGQEFKNCERNNDGSLSFFSGPNYACELDDVTAFQVPMSVTFSTGKYLGLGISLTHTFSDYENYSGIRLVIPFGQYN